MEAGLLSGAVSGRDHARAVAFWLIIVVIPCAVQALHVMLQDCVECMGVGANMGRSDTIAEEGSKAVSAVAQGAAVAKEMGDVRWAQGCCRDSLSSPLWQI